jgi:hypothetical protein
MSDESLTDVAFAAGEERANMVGGIGSVVVGGYLLFVKGASIVGWGILLILMGARMLWRCIRLWNKPYVLLRQDRLVVFDCGRPTQYVPLGDIAEVQPCFNGTMLILRDGLRLRISHIGFVSKADADRLRTELLTRAHPNKAEPVRSP